MKESILDALMYLFDNFVDTPGQPVNTQSVADDMFKAGFEAYEVDGAIDWFENLRYLQAQAKELASPSAKAFRIYSIEEMQKITEMARRYLIFLEQSGIVDPVSRELVINRAMALQDASVDAAKLKWIVLLVLFDQPHLQDKLEMMEELVFNETSTQH
jgi:Smg protein